MTNLETDSKLDVVDFELLGQILKKQNIPIGITQLTEIFGKYEHEKKQFITDIIDAYYQNNESSFGPHLSDKVYECILYKYIQKFDLMTTHFIKIATIIIQNKYPDINIDEFNAIVKNHTPPINGNTFIKGT
eukprot:197335_1